MPGAIDANGIYQYNETDLASPRSTLLNKLAASVSAVVLTLKNRVTALENAWGVRPRAWNFNRSSSNETDVITLGAYQTVVSGAIANAPAGDYLIAASGGFSAGNVQQAFIRVTAGAGNIIPDYRLDQDINVKHISNAGVLTNFAGGTLNVALAYYQAAGAAYVQRSGTHISVAYLGPRV